MTPDAFARLVAPVRPRMVNCVWRIVRAPADVDDVLQEVLLHVWRRFAEIETHPNPTALLLRISTQKALDHLRRNKRRGAAHDAALAADAVRPAGAASPRAALAAAEERAALLAFVATLPAREAEAVTLHLVEELDYAAVAAAMDCAEPTVRVLVGRARERFRARFAPPRGPLEPRPASAAPDAAPFNHD